MSCARALSAARSRAVRLASGDQAARSGTSRISTPLQSHCPPSASLHASSRGFASSSGVDPRLGLDEEQTMMYDAARDFAAAELEPFHQQWDQEHFFPVETLKKAAEMGFGGIYVPAEFGGAGLKRFDGSAIFEALATGCVPTTAYLTIHNMCCWMIAEFGSAELKAKFLPSLTAMDLLSSYCLTEPGAGSDASSLATTAVRKGDTYVLNGSKQFISGAGASDVYIVMARTGGPGPKGISTFVVEKDAPGLSFGKLEHKMGWNCQPTAQVLFEDCEVPAANLVGAEGDGFTFAMRGLDGGRINIASCSLGGAQQALDLAVAYTQERHQFGQPIAANQHVQFSLADMATSLHASRQVVREAAKALDAKHAQHVMLCAMAKRMATDTCFDVANQALQLHGGYGYLQEYPIEKIVRDLRVHSILEGTNEIMRMIISKRMVAP